MKDSMSTRREFYLELTPKQKVQSKWTIAFQSYTIYYKAIIIGWMTARYSLWHLLLIAILNETHISSLVT